MLCVGTVSLTTSQEKCNASFENQRYFFKLKHPEQQNKKLECFEQEKVLGKALL